MLDRCRQHPGEVVTDHEHHQCIQKAVKPAKEPAQETTQTCEHPFNLVDHILHNLVLSCPFGHKNRRSMPPCVYSFYNEHRFTGIWEVCLSGTVEI